MRKARRDEARQSGLVDGPGRQRDEAPLGVLPCWTDLDLIVPDPLRPALCVVPPELGPVERIWKDDAVFPFCKSPTGHKECLQIVGPWRESDEELGGPIDCLTDAALRR